MEIKNIRKALIIYGKSVVTKMTEVLSETRSLKNDIEPIIKEDSEGISLTIEIPAYGKFVDSGRKPGSKMPPIQPIKDWAKGKGIAQFRDKKGKYISYDARAWLIAHKIGRDGIKARPFINLLYSNMEDLQELLGDASAEDIAIFLETELKNQNLKVTKE